MPLCIFPYYSVLSRQLIWSCCESEIAYFGKHILDFPPATSAKIIIAAVNSSIAVGVNLTLHQFLSFNEISKNIFVFKTHKDVP